MNTFRIVLLVLAMFSCFLLSTWGFSGRLPSWMGGLGWMLLAISSVKDLANLTANRKSKKQFVWVMKELDAAVKTLKEMQCKKD